MKVFAPDDNDDEPPIASLPVGVASFRLRHLLPLPVSSFSPLLLLLTLLLLLSRLRRESTQSVTLHSLAGSLAEKKSNFESLKLNLDRSNERKVIFCTTYYYIVSSLFSVNGTILLLRFNENLLLALLLTKKIIRLFRPNE